jgi:hypothetical protein
VEEGVLVYCVPAIAVLLVAAAFSPILEAQMRGMQRPAAPSRITTGPRFGVVQARPGGFRPMSPRLLGSRNLWIHPAFRHHFRFNIFFGNSCFNGAFFDPFFCRQFLFPNRFLFTQPVFVPYPVYSAPYYPVIAEPPTETVDREGDLATEIEQLKDEVERLRAEETSRAQGRQAVTQPRPVEENVPTILVFRDGRRREIRNYAVLGQILWALTEQHAQKIAISDLDLDATKKVNADRGVEIRLP